MPLITSVSGIRGTIGGVAGENLTPQDAVAFASAYAAWLQSVAPGDHRLKVAVGRDARPSGPAIQSLVVSTLVSMGIDVLDLGLSTTPTVEVMVPWEGCDGGIILTASHNPVEWNALKLLNARGEFLSAEDGAQILARVQAGGFEYAPVHEMGEIIPVHDAIDRHVQSILALEDVDVEAIRAAHFRVAVDAVNSTGGIAVPALLDALGVTNQELLYCEPHGQFPHNPEPLRKHLDAICALVPAKKCDLGVVVDPDVDRLVLVSEDGELFGEEYTLVAVADYLLAKRPGHCVSNLSSSRALRDVAARHGSTYSASAVGEVHVVNRNESPLRRHRGRRQRRDHLSRAALWPRLPGGHRVVFDAFGPKENVLLRLRASYPTTSWPKKRLPCALHGCGWPARFRRRRIRLILPQHHRWGED